MNEHEDFQRDLPAYAAARLDHAAARRLEDHFKECASCREMVDTLKEFASTLREGGEALFEPHPAESTLRSYAGGGAVAQRGQIEAHLKVCATCSLELESWKRSGALSEDRLRPASGGLQKWGVVALAAAAGLVVGLGISEILKAPQPRAPQSVAQGPSEPDLDAGPLLFLPRALRGEGASVRYRINSKQTLVVIACPVSIPDQAAPHDVFRYEIRKAGGRVVWSRAMTSEAIREQLDGVAGAVTLVAPAASLEPGPYSFSLSSADRPDEILYRADLEFAGSP